MYRKCMTNIPTSIKVRFKDRLYSSVPMDRCLAPHLISSPLSKTPDQSLASICIYSPRSESLQVLHQRIKRSRDDNEGQVNLHNNVSGGVAWQSFRLALCVSVSFMLLWIRRICPLCAVLSLINGCTDFPCIKELLPLKMMKMWMWCPVPCCH